MGDEVLRKIPLFAGLEADERADLGGLLKTRQYQAQAPVFWIGENGTEFYIVQDGAVTVSAPDEHGKEVTLAKLGPGNFFGEISLLDGGPRSATLTAGDRGLETFAVSALTFSPLIDAHPGLSRSLLRALCARIRALDVEASATC